MKCYVEVTVPPGVRLMVHISDTAAATLVLTEEQAWALANDLRTAAGLVKDMRRGRTTRPMCTACQRDVSECNCSSATKGGEA